MRIEIIGILDAGQRAVEFTCAAGRAWGTWKGEEDPVIGTHDVEFAIDEGVDWQASSASTQGEICARRSGRDQWISVSGIVERADDDSVVTLRIRTELVMVEMADAGCVVARGDAVTIRVKNLDIYPYRL
ncbi:hypothetical protein [Streptomyces sp. NPDC002537]